MKARQLFDGPIVQAGARRELHQAEPAHADEEPGHLRGRGRVRDGDHPDLRRHHERRARRVRHGDRPRPVVHGAVRELRGGHGGGPGEGAGRCAPEDASGPRRPSRERRRVRGDRSRHAAAGRRHRDGDGGRVDPRGRRHRRGHRLGRRVGHHGRVRAGHPRVRRRPLSRHRRHEGAVGLDQGADHGRAGRVVPGPDDLPRRGRRASEDPERDRAVDPAREVHDHLPDRLRRPAAVRDLLGEPPDGRGPDRAVRLPDPDDDRRACSPRSASRGWTAWCSTTCSP